MTSSSSMLMEPKYLAAAALAWSVVSNSKKDRYKLPEGNSDDDTAVLNPIPEIEGPSLNENGTPDAKRHVVPIVVKSSPSTATVHATTPTQAKVSAATMRQLESRRRVRSAMEQYQHHHNHKKDAPTKPTASSGASVTNASIGTSPKVTTAKTPLKHNLSHSGAQNRTPEAKASPTTASTASPPPTVVHCQPVRFKVKSSTTGTVLRFQCIPTYSSVTHNIVERLCRSSTKSLWSTASNMLSSTFDHTNSGIDIQFEDAEGDWCTLSNDEDLQDAVEAAAGRQDTMVRLNVEEQGTATRVWQSISTQFGW